jgi:hypothetical protein
MGGFQQSQCHLASSAIDLLPGTTPPRGRLYSLSGPETKAMETYIEDSLAAVSTTEGLNDIMVKKHYPLPLIAFGFSRGLSWTSGTPTIWYGYRKGMSGRPPLTWLACTTNTW